MYEYIFRIKCHLKKKTKPRNITREINQCVASHLKAKVSKSVSVIPIWLKTKNIVRTKLQFGDHKGRERHKWRISDQIEINMRYKEMGEL